MKGAKILLMATVARLDKEKSIRQGWDKKAANLQ